MASKKKPVIWQVVFRERSVSDQGRLLIEGIPDPRGKAKSVVLTEEGLARSEMLFGELVLVE